MTRPGMFCVFEGIDGSGKTTLLSELKCACEERLAGDAGPPQFSEVVLLREPTELESGKKIRRLLAERAELDPAEWLELFIEDRACNVKENILPIINRGCLILQDRYYYSTAAYQGFSDGGLTAEEALQQNRNRSFPEPDRLFFMDISVKSALARLQKSRQNLETFENGDELRRIDHNYRKILPEDAIYLVAEQELSAIVSRALASIFDGE